MKTDRPTLRVQAIRQLKDLISEWRFRRAFANGTVPSGQMTDNDMTRMSRRQHARSRRSITQHKEVLMLRRLGSIVALAVLSTVITIASSSPAQAATTPCAQSSGIHCTEFSMWYSSSRGDSFLTTKWHYGEDHIGDGGYVFIRTPGNIADPAWPQPLGTVALWNWYSPSRQDNFATTDPAWIPNGPSDTRDSGGLYLWPSLLGYVWTTNVTPCISAALDLWWNPILDDNALNQTLFEPPTPERLGYYYGGRQGYYDGGNC